jgi:chorismate dehydratase
VSVLRIGVMPYLLGRPLVRGLAAHAPTHVRLVEDVPSAIGQLLIDGELDAALAPIAMTLAHPELCVIPGLGVACDGPVASIKLFHRVPPEELTRVALDTSSRTAALLTQVLLRTRFGAAPDFVHAEPDLDAMLEKAGGALLIGDNALVASGPPYLDLGEEWKAHTGLGFVFAMWAYSPTLERTRQAQLAELLYASLARGEAELEQILEEPTRPRPLTPDAARRYLTENIRYRLQEVHLRGLERFVENAVDLDLLPEDTRVPQGAWAP